MLAVAFSRGITNLYEFYNVGIVPLPAPPRPHMVRYFHYAVLLWISETEKESVDKVKKEMPKSSGHYAPNVERDISFSPPPQHLTGRS